MSMKACKRLASAISPWLYSVGQPPRPLNELFLAWIDHGHTPTEAEVDLAIEQANELLKQRKNA
jgi:hypothetical protein